MIFFRGVECRFLTENGQAITRLRENIEIDFSRRQLPARAIFIFI